MEFGFSEEQVLLCENARKFMQSKEVKAWVEDAYQTKEFPFAFMRKAAGYGYLGLNVDEKYGGSGLNFLDALMVLGEIAHVSCALALDVIVHNTLFNFAVETFGREDQKQKYLPRSVAGEIFGCVANTESGAGSDAKNIQLKAVPSGHKWILNGTKCFITSTSVASIAVISARTAKRRTGHPGITAFLIDVGKDVPGFTLDRVEEKIGQHGAPLCQFTLTDYEACDENILGELHGGWKVFDGTFQHSRTAIAIQGVELAQHAFDEMVVHTREHTVFGKSIFEQSKPEIADMHKEIQAARLLAYTAADFESRSNPRFTEASSLAKLAGTEVALKAALLFFQKCGGKSYILHSLSSRLVLDALALTIYEGTSEVQRLIIAKKISEKIAGRRA